MKRYQFQHSSIISQSNQKMKQNDYQDNKKYQEQQLLQNVKMDGSVCFQTNGDINVYPCPWESDKKVTDGARVRYRGGIEVDADGRTRVKRYHDGKYGPKYEVLYETAHGKVQMSHPQIRPGDKYRRISEEFVFVTFKFPKKYGVALMEALLQEEHEEVMSYLNTRKEETVWK